MFENRLDLHKQTLQEDPPNFDLFFDEFKNKIHPMMDLSLLPPSVTDNKDF